MATQPESKQDRSCKVGEDVEDTEAASLELESAGISNRSSKAEAENKETEVSRPLELPSLQNRVLDVSFFKESLSRWVSTTTTSVDDNIGRVPSKQAESVPIPQSNVRTKDSKRKRVQEDEVAKKELKTREEELENENAKLKDENDMLCEFLAYLIDKRTHS